MPLTLITHNGKPPSQGGRVLGVRHSDGRYAAVNIPFAEIQANHLAYQERQDRLDLGCPKEYTVDARPAPVPTPTFGGFEVAERGRRSW